MDKSCQLSFQAPKSMCGRYKLSRQKQLVEEYFDTASDAED